MNILLRLLVLSPLAVAPFAAEAQGTRYRPGYAPEPDVTGSLGRGGQYPLGYDTGGDFDRRPERPAYQQGGGQQTGGPARNLIPGDRIHIFPR